MSSQHSTVFGTAPDDYQRHRVPLPPEAVRWLVPPGCGTAVEIGPGTGLFTSQLADLVGEVLAVEPDVRMRARLQTNCPDVTVLDGTAEALPVDDHSADAVIAVASWHWVDPEAALREIARVLRPGGTVAVGWNTRAPSELWLQEIESVISSAHQDGRRPGDFDIPADFPFTAVQREVFAYSRRMTVDEAVRMLGTYSGVLGRPLVERRDLLAAATRRMREQVGDSEVVQVPFESVCCRSVVQH